MYDTLPIRKTFGFSLTSVHFDESKGNCKMNITLARQVQQEILPIMIHAHTVFCLLPGSNYGPLMVSQLQSAGGKALL